MSERIKPDSTMTNIFSAIGAIGGAVLGGLAVLKDAFPKVSEPGLGMCLIMLEVGIPAAILMMGAYWLSKKIETGRQ